MMHAETTAGGGQEGERGEDDHTELFDGLSSDSCGSVGVKVAAVR